MPAQPAGQAPPPPAQNMSQQNLNQIVSYFTRLIRESLRLSVSGAFFRHRFIVSGLRFGHVGL